MEAKLVKRSNSRFDLYTIEDINQLNTIASSFDNPKGKLSLKNCEAIANGYDLDELLDGLLINRGEHLSRVRNPLYGEERQLAKDLVQKTLELIGDKKFSEEDMRKSMQYTVEQYNYNSLYTMKNGDHPTVNNYIQSLQQTEWVVEVEIDTTQLTLMGRNLGRNLGILPDLKPKLDADGCLILKRI